MEAFSETTLEAAFALDYPDYELIFCLARADDPAAPLARRAMERHSDRKARLLVGDERPSANPKLNNVVKGWKAAHNAWIIIADSNVLMPPDYIQRLMASWRSGVGVVCAPPIGSAPESLAAEWECAFLNTYEARWQYAADACGLGFAQGKSMLWRRDVLEAGGGVERLGDEIAEDAAATKLVRRARLRPRLAAGPFDQPLGRRAWSEVWGRQARWARLRRATFPLFFAPELFTSGLLAIGAAAFGAAAIGVASAQLGGHGRIALVRKRGGPGAACRLETDAGDAGRLRVARRDAALAVAAGVDDRRFRVARAHDVDRRRSGAAGALTSGAFEVPRRADAL